MRRSALRYGDARSAGSVRTDLGHPGSALLAESNRAGTKKISSILLYGRGLLGPRVDDAAARLRLRLSQTALRSTARRSCPPGAWAPSRRPGLQEQAGAFSRKPRRAAAGDDVFAGHP